MGFNRIGGSGGGGGGGGIPDAPSNDILYGRRNALWHRVVAPLTALTPPVSAVPWENVQEAIEGLHSHVVTADTVPLNPEIPPWTNVQEAVEGISTGYVKKSGDTMTGNLAIRRPVLATSGNALEVVDDATLATVVEIRNTRDSAIANMHIANNLGNALSLTAVGQPGPIGFFGGNVSVINSKDMPMILSISRGSDPSFLAMRIDLDQQVTVPKDPIAPTGVATKRYVDTAGGAFVPIAGGTMTGPLVLSEDPVQPLQAATKDYVDTFLPLSGGTMTGDLILAHNPVLEMEAVTKTYVDARLTGTLVFIGGIDATTAQCRFTLASGYPSPGPVPPADATNANQYLICERAGTIPSGPAAGISLVKGDWLVSNGQNWYGLSVGTVGLLASQVGLLPSVLGADEVQTALEHVAAQLRPWAAGQNYKVGQDVVYDNRIFAVLADITNAPATPDFTTIVPVGYGQSDYWEGNADFNNWEAGNWAYIASLPAYGTYMVQISDLHPRNDTSLMLNIVTGYGTATAVLTGQTHQGTGSWSELRLSQPNAGAAVRLELRIATRDGWPSFKVVIGGETRGTTVNQVMIQKPLQARAGGTDMGGNTLAHLPNLLIATFATSGDMVTAYSKSIQFAYPSGLDMNDGKIGARLYARGLNVLGIATETDDANRYISLWGDVQLQSTGSQMIAPNFVSPTDGQGLTTYAGGRFYKAVGSGIIIRQVGTSQPQIEDNDGTNRRAIIDTVNGDARYVLKSGDVLTGSLTMANGLTGYLTWSGGGLLDQAGSRLTLRCESGNGQPRIQNNDGTNPRDIIDTVNGDARYVLKGVNVGGAYQRVNGGSWGTARVAFARIPNGSDVYRVRGMMWKSFSNGKPFIHFDVTTAGFGGSGGPVNSWSLRRLALHHGGLAASFGTIYLYRDTTTNNAYVAVDMSNNTVNVTAIFEPTYSDGVDFTNWREVSPNWQLIASVNTTGLAVESSTELPGSELGIPEPAL